MTLDTKAIRERTERLSTISHDVEALCDEVDRLRKELADLQVEQGIGCSYCDPDYDATTEGVPAGSDTRTQEADDGTE